MYYFFTKRHRYFKNKISEKYSIGGDTDFKKSIGLSTLIKKLKKTDKNREKN